MPAETVVGVFARAALSDALTALHRARFGPQTRVLDGARAPLGAQLRRAGLARELATVAADLTREHALILVNAPGRGAEAARLLAQVGASDVVVLGEVPAAAAPSSPGLPPTSPAWPGGALDPVPNSGD